MTDVTKDPTLLINYRQSFWWFREHPFTVPGDIEAMYNQVLVPYEDRDVLRFLWFDGENIAHYRMKVHLFGGRHPIFRSWINQQIMP